MPKIKITLAIQLKEYPHQNVKVAFFKKIIYVAACYQL